MLLIRNLKVKGYGSFGIWDDFVTSQVTTLPRLNEARKLKPSLTLKRHRFSLKTIHISLTISYFL